MGEKKEYLIKVQGQLIPVTEEVYLAYYRMKRRERHLEEKDIKHGVFYYSALDTKETTGEDGIPDLTSPPIEDFVMDKLIAEKLRQCILQLSQEEQALILTLFFQNKSEHQLAAETGIPRMTIHNRKKRILAQLKKLMEN
ncbi:RNA polymerase sigma factor (sigma-70 family) [Natranaerovirga hydrolytica]|uniref:RNA polymerase sigma factor (Sigma-70 family) n=1 Tax=Natranaerovirga hydrolytica TaxID=680378 RepID=A0A4R1M9S1_9FIRM|nr:sigma-70 family RNA polymerase sigma factor [Natranaerovirga hydrolytica]TCK89106.1 RNA polymerase sigma factor (sigma-70 family) [Natranaerovirga hydrolytica]